MDYKLGTDVEPLRGLMVKLILKLITYIITPPPIIILIIIIIIEIII